MTCEYIFCPDIFGHVNYSYNHPDQANTTLETVVKPLRVRFGEDDELVAITDYGMKKEEGAGEHPASGWFSTTVDGPLLENPVAVRAWIETQIRGRGEQTEEVLKDRGYL